MQGGGIGKEAGVQCFGREVLPGTRIGQGIGMIGETDRRGCFGGEADVPGVDADGIQFPLDAAAEGVVSQLGQGGGMTAQPSDRGAECGDASADLCAERPGLRQRSSGIGGREAKPDFPDANRVWTQQTPPSEKTMRPVYTQAAVCAIGADNLRAKKRKELRSIR